MFCTKLRELKIPGDCPFAPSGAPNIEVSGGDADALPISEDVHGNIGEGAPQQKTARARVSLHSLGDSIRKLACPDVS